MNAPSKQVQLPETKLIPRSVLFGNPERSDPTLSPDGKQLAYLAPVNGVLNVWIRTLGQSDDRPVTDDTGRGIHIFAWQYDSKHILYAQDAAGDENWRIYQTDIATRQTRDLTPFEKVQASIVAYEWHTPETLLVGSNQRDESLFDIYRLDLMTDCPELSFRQRIQFTHVGGSSSICSPIDLTIQFRQAGARRLCPVSDMRKLRPDEVAALPKRLRP